MCCGANEGVEQGEREHKSLREEEKEIESENNLGLEFDLTQFLEMNIGCSCDSNICTIYVEINSCINSMSLESAYFPLVADDFGYEHIVSIDFSDNVHASTQIEELSKVQDNKDFSDIHGIDSPICICNALNDDFLVGFPYCVSDHAFTNKHTDLNRSDSFDSLLDRTLDLLSL